LYDHASESPLGGERSRMLLTGRLLVFTRDYRRLPTARPEAQRSLTQFFKPRNWFEVRGALIRAGRTDPIGSGRDPLIPSQPPKKALEARRKPANRALNAHHDHAVPTVKCGYRPGRTSQPQQTKPGREKS
jgi:hypothetical protein